MIKEFLENLSPEMLRLVASQYGLQNKTREMQIAALINLFTTVLSNSRDIVMPSRDE
jgi:hypothetical protein